MNDIEEKFNPWLVNFLEDFLFYCCPECDFKHDEKSSFMSHAVVQHPLSRTIVGNLGSKNNNSHKVKSDCDKTVIIKQTNPGDFDDTVQVKSY